MTNRIRLIQQERDEKKARDVRYRAAAARLTTGTVSDYAQVVESADRDGAFVEVTIWVSKAEADAEARR